MLLKEIERVLRPGGILLLFALQSWRFYNPPNDYFRFTRFGLQYLLEKNGLAPVEISPMGGMWSMVIHRVVFRLYDRFQRFRLLYPLARLVAFLLLTLALLLDWRD